MTLARAVALVGGFTMLSRIAGYVRDSVMALFLGAGPVADAFVIAFKLPNFFRRLFAEGAFNAAFVPLFGRKLHEEGPEGARAFAAQAQAILLAMLLPLSVLMMAFMPAVIDLLAFGIDPGSRTYALAVEFSRITFPYLLFISLVSLQGGILNTLGKFGHVSATPILLNLALIAAAFGLTPLLPSAGHALSWGVFAAGVIQYLWLMIVCRRQGYGLGLRRPVLSPDIRRLLKLMVPVAIGGGVMQINAMLDVVWASFLPAGAISYLYYADRVNELPLGVVGIAIGTALLPLLTRQLRAGDEAAALHNQNRALEIGLLLTLPATAALLVIPEPIVRVLFARGAFDAAAASATADALAAFALGLPAFVLIKVLTPGFYAREDTRTPVLIALAAIAANIAFNLLLIPHFAHVGIALASSLSGWLNALLLALLLNRRGFWRPDRRLLERAWRQFLAAALMAGLVWHGARLLAPWLDGREIERIPAMALLVAAGGLAYLAAALALRAGTLGELRNTLRRQPNTPPPATDEGVAP